MKPLMHDFKNYRIINQLQRKNKFPMTIEELVALCYTPSKGEISHQAVVRALNRINIFDIPSLLSTELEDIKHGKGIGLVKYEIITNMINKCNELINESYQPKKITKKLTAIVEPKSQILNETIANVLNNINVHSSSYLKTARELLEFSLQDIADLMYTSKQRIWDIENCMRGYDSLKNRQHYSILIAILLKTHKNGCNIEKALKIMYSE